MDLTTKRIVDLSHKVVSNMPADPTLKLPTLDFFSRVGQDIGDGIHNLEVLSYCPHTGTHMDSPLHVLQDGGDLTTVDPLILCGPARVVKIDAPQYTYGISSSDLRAWEREHGEIKENEAVLLQTGQAELWEKGFDEFIGKGFVYLEKDAAEYLVEKHIRYVAIESIGVDLEGVDSHTILLDNGVTVVENICNLDQIHNDTCYTIGTFPNIKGATGAWIRLLAICD